MKGKDGRSSRRSCKITLQRQEEKERLQIEAEEAEIKNVDMPITKSMWRMMLLESTSDDCRELVKLLVEKPERLKEPSLLCLAAHKLGALPGLTLVGEAEDVNTIECAQKQTERKNTVEFIGKHS